MLNALRLRSVEPGARERALRRVSKLSLLALALAGFALAGIASAASAAPMDRKLELVTPSGSTADIQISSTALTPDGNTVCFSTEDDMAGSVTNGNKLTIDGFCARRSPTGWETRWETGPTPTVITGSSGGEVWAVSPDGKKVLFTSDMNIFPDWFRTEGPGRMGSDSSYLREADSLRWLSPAPEDPSLWGPEFRHVTGGNMSGGAEMARGPAAMTEDLSYGVFESVLRLLPSDMNDVIDTYMWTPAGIELVSHDPDGKAMGGRPPLKHFSQRFGAQGSLSDDGSRVFFERLNGYGGARPDAPDAVYSVYMREGGAVSLLPLRQGGDTAANIRFEGATGDGKSIYVSSTERLTSSAKETGAALYRYDVDADDLAMIATVVGGVEFLGSSKDGSTVVYRTVSAPRELRLLRGEVTQTLGTLHTTDFNANGWVASVRPDKRALRISDDGKVVAFAAAGSFTEPNAGNRIQAYRWAEQGGLLRISAPPGGGSATAHSNIGNPGGMIPNIGDDSRYKPFAPIRGGANLGAVMSDDGSRVFFETSQRLVDADVNEAVDVYEWHDGEVQLVSPGTQEHDALYHDSSADGSTVFFITRSALIPELDRNSVRDLYAMRVGGGFPLPEKAVPCDGDACQGALPAVGPPAPSPATAALSGGGNVSPDRTKPASVRAVAPRSVRGSRVPIRVSVSAPGRIAVSGRTVRAASRGAGKAGSYRLGVRLKPAAKRALRRRGSVLVTVRVRFRPRQGRAITRQVKVRLRAGAGRSATGAGRIQAVTSGKEAR